MSQILYSKRMAWPTAWDEVFGRKAPLILEIGFGGGHFLIDLARKRPFHNILGIEISLPSLRRGAQKLRVAELENGRVMQADSRTALWLLCELESIAEVYINFPDPWPKSGQKHRRLISDKFLHLLATRMPVGAPLDIATDHADYAAAMIQVIERTPYFKSRLDTTYVTEDNERLRTKYEQIGLDEGRICHYFKWERNDTPAPNDFPPLKEHPMPHVVMQIPLPLDEVQTRFTPWQVKSGETHLKFLELFQSQRDGKLLIDLYVSEEPFHQRVCLALRRSQSTKHVVVSLHEIGFPRPTTGIHLAVQAVADWLLALHPDVAIINSTLKELE